MASCLNGLKDSLDQSQDLLDWLIWFMHEEKEEYEENFPTL